MFISGVGTMIVIENGAIGIVLDLGLDQGVDLIIDLDLVLVLVQDQRGKSNIIPNI